MGMALALAQYHLPSFGLANISYLLEILVEGPGSHGGHCTFNPRADYVQV